MLSGAWFCGVMELFQTVICLNYSIAHQSAPQSTTYTRYVHHSTEPHSRQTFF